MRFRLLRRSAPNGSYTWPRMWRSGSVACRAIGVRRIRGLSSERYRVMPAGRVFGQLVVGVVEPESFDVPQSFRDFVECGGP